jgi:F-type H+-transporting ATPase subunit delta
MRGTSREAFAAGRERLEALLAGAAAGAGPQAGTGSGATALGAAGPKTPAPRPAAPDPVALGEELFGVTSLLDRSAAVRRALTDPSRTPDAKAALVHRLLDGKVSSQVVELLVELVRGRWGAATDLSDATEWLAVEAVVAAADRAGRLDAVEDELFRFARAVAGNLDLRDAFSVRTVGADRKGELVRHLLNGKVSPETLLLAVQASTSPRGLRTEQALERYVEAAAARRKQLVAHVVVARPLAEDQRERLAAALQRVYGRAPRLNVDVDPDVVGGLRVQVGGELIDGTMLGRLDDARRRLAG